MKPEFSFNTYSPWLSKLVGKYKPASQVATQQNNYAVI